ncbi:LysR substrate-binding domain-containing protein, partial [Enterobacter cloacae]|uniref:LysR substrate-binding domain-containing protein n=1 Tax=Enterobacter cloacae TaxID=550 RepID=UPI0021CFD9C9
MIMLKLFNRCGIHVWEFEKEGKKISVRLQGQTTFNNTYLMMQAALDGLGLAYVPLELAQPHIESGELICVLQDWCPLLPGYHLYYTSRHQLTPVLAEVISALRYHN